MSCSKPSLDPYDLIRKCHRYCNDESDKNRLRISMNRVNDRVRAMLGVSRSSVARAMKEPHIQIMDLGETKTPPSGKHLVLDGFDGDMIVRKIYEQWGRGQLLTIDDLKEDLAKDNLVVSRSTLWRFLRRNGFKFKKVLNDHNIMQRGDLVAWRARYLRALGRYRQEGRPIVFLDETWLNAGQSTTRQWMGEATTRPWAAQSGARLIIVDAGGASGFVPGANLAFLSRTTRDYHEEMDGERFTKWFTEKLIPNLQPDSVIIMDNAPYHSVQASGSRIPTRKDDMKLWLREKGITFEEGMFRMELHALVKLHHRKSYTVDRIAATHGHVMLRLPPYHAFLNPIESVWSVMKARVSQLNTTGKIHDVEKHFTTARTTIQEDNIWKECARHVMEEEERLRRMEGVLEEIEEFIIRDNSSESEEDEEGELDESVVGCADEAASKESCGQCRDGSGPEEDWVGCDGCSQWFHWRCLERSDVQEAQTSLEAGTNWLCEPCRVAETQKGDLRHCPVRLAE